MIEYIFLASLFLLFLTVGITKTFSLNDFAVVLSYFYVFFRTIYFDDCNQYFNENLYFFEEHLYYSSNLIGGMLLITFQLGYLFSSLLYKKNNLNILNYNFERYDKLIGFFFYGYIILLLICVFLYGDALFPWNRMGSAVSVNLKGFQFIWPFINVLLFALLTLLVFKLFNKYTTKNLIILLFVIITTLVLGRRGIILKPLFLVFTLIFFYQIIINKKSLLSFFTLPNILIFFIALIVVLYGKSIVSFFIDNNNVISKITSTIPQSCLIINLGQQEFDLFWPAVFKESSIENLLHIPSALLGNFIPHETRLLHYPELYNSTDYMMMKYNKNAYLYDKFGISMNFLQFHYYNFEYLSFITIFIFGFITVLLIRLINNAFFEQRFFDFLIYYHIYSFLFSPIDFSFKYFIFSIFVIFFLRFVYEFLCLKKIKF